MTTTTKKCGHLKITCVQRKLGISCIGLSIRTNLCPLLFYGCMFLHGNIKLSSRLECPTCRVLRALRSHWSRRRWRPSAVCLRTFRVSVASTACIWYIIEQLAPSDGELQINLIIWSCVIFFPPKSLYNSPSWARFDWKVESAHIPVACKLNGFCVWSIISVIQLN